MESLAEETTRLYEALLKDLRVRFKPGQPYATASDLHRVITTRYLVVSTDNNVHPVWTCEGKSGSARFTTGTAHFDRATISPLDGELGELTRRQGATYPKRKSMHSSLKSTYKPCTM